MTPSETTPSPLLEVEPPPRRPAPPSGFGLIVIGDEVLNGPRVDRHFAAFQTLLAARGHRLAWHWVLPDEPVMLRASLAFSLRGPAPVFVCGGIGATPDDHTRSAAAAAAGLPLTRHPQAAALIEARFGEQAYPQRIRMADLPAGCTLIPNPVNRIPGFRVGEHWFLPGFPSMAWPMAEWVLDQGYARGQPWSEVALEVPGIPESSLIPLLERLTTAFPELKLFCLPHRGEDAHLRVGFRGPGGASPDDPDSRRLAEALEALRAGLQEDGLPVRQAVSECEGCVTV